MNDKQKQLALNAFIFYCMKKLLHSAKYKETIFFCIHPTQSDRNQVGQESEFLCTTLSQNIIFPLSFPKKYVISPGLFYW